jgi:thymidine phosphorylase
MESLCARLVQSEKAKKSTQNYTKKEINDFLDAMVKERFSPIECTALDFISLVRKIIRSKTGVL